MGKKQEYFCPESRARTEDEVDLVDLGVAFAKRWKLIVSVFAICTVLGVIAALFKQPTYRYSSSISMAAYATPQGHMIWLLTPGSATAILQNGLVAQAIRQYTTAHHLNPEKINITVTNPAHGHVVLLSGKGPIELKKAYEAIESNIAELLDQHTSAQINSYQSGILSKLRRAKLKLTRLEDLKMVQSRKVALKVHLLAAQAQMSALKAQKELLLEKRKDLKRSMHLYEVLAKKLNHYLDTARTSSPQMTHTSKPVTAMSVMLLDNQIQQNLQEWTHINQQLTVGLPQDLAKVNSDLLANQRQQVMQSLVIERAQLDYEHFKTHHERRIQGQKIKIASFVNQLDNIQHTQLIANPSQSVLPVGKSRKVIVILAGVAGLFLGILSAVMASYIQAVRANLRSKSLNHQG